VSELEATTDDIHDELKAAAAARSVSASK